ncbi:flavodoxin [Blastococcus sp. TF02A-30]|uniref:flavodoxin family protein n=1 Tax=Blastococcus sp. TF02A-30 TaxID=2250580 RepID=UPI000DE9A829|nr:flavodoxin [Blastococcus sp. TF02A-30]RBY91073.1 flavodoxin [Blastococcus sp. TF02A-30]
MTRALVVYESLFGDARQIALAIADGLASTMPVDVVAAGDAPSEVDADVALLVVGGPNHAMSMPRPSTRADAAAKQGADVADPAYGLHEWLDDVRLPRGVRAAAYDTRMSHPKLLVKLDHASRTEEKLLQQHGAELAAPAEHFTVQDAKGPLVDGEEDRARRWGQALAQLLGARAPHA